MQQRLLIVSQYFMYFQGGWVGRGYGIYLVPRTCTIVIDYVFINSTLSCHASPFTTSNIPHAILLTLLSSFVHLSLLLSYGHMFPLDAHTLGDFVDWIWYHERHCFMASLLLVLHKETLADCLMNNLEYNLYKNVENADRMIRNCI